jgi:hypothetical protein
MEDITLIILDKYSILSLPAVNGAEIQIKLTPAQLAYIEEKINFNHKLKALGEALKAGN